MSEPERTEEPQVVNMAIIERDDRLMVLMPQGATMADAEDCHAVMVSRGWPAERVMVLVGAEAFAVLKGATQETTHG